MAVQLDQCFHRIFTLDYSIKMGASGIGFGMHNHCLFKDTVDVVNLHN